MTFEKDISEAKDLCWSGMESYRAGNFRAAISQLKQGLSGDAENWQARLFLGMSYVKDEQLENAESVFRYILDGSSDIIIRKKAEIALVAIRETLQHSAQKAVRARQSAAVGNDDGNGPGT